MPLVTPTVANVETRLYERIATDPVGAPVRDLLTNGDPARAALRLVLRRHELTGAATAPPPPFLVYRPLGMQRPQGGLPVVSVMWYAYAPRHTTELAPTIASAIEVLHGEAHTLAIDGGRISSGGIGAEDFDLALGLPVFRTVTIRYEGVIL